MGTLRAGVLLVSITLAGCSGDPAGGWSRVVRGNDLGVYSLVHADPLTDTCVNITMRQPGMLVDPDAGIDVVVKGANSEVLSSYGTGVSAQACTNEFWNLSPNSGPHQVSVTGKIKFTNFINTEVADAPCSISFDLVVEAFDGKIYEIADSKFPITDLGCPRPHRYAAEYDDLQAAYGEYGGSPNLVVSSWDPEREVCVWARFLSTHAVDAAANAVDAPGTWFYSGLRFGLTGREACVASDLVTPPNNPPYLSDSAAPMASSGALSFVTSETRELMSGPLEVPCSLDVELALQSLGRYHWTPDDIALQGEGITVAGACE